MGILVLLVTFMGHPSIKNTCVFRHLFGARVRIMYYIGHPSKKIFNSGVDWWLWNTRIENYLIGVWIGDYGTPE